MRNIILVGLIFGLVGCAGKPVKALDSAKLNTIREVCIERNSKVTIPSFENDLERAFIENGIKSKFYSDIKPTECQNRLTYSAQRSWDMAVCTSVIQLDLYDANGDQIAKVDWEQNPLALNKWRGTDAKVLDTVNKLLGKPKIN
ncbi:hypothetical protein RMB13_07005 [Acinetobacter sp. V102_4]|uniref:hypothetical protein n=1 Tax=Acinetobacter sp. V102_4 TaxID=3072984 RepID=UPI00287BE9C4|nr:hypothetical protein [Acinetobacter sp. V102_4]MDS7929226.1 hypothetical protein [Acinetobacter sp. V102_4]